MSQRQRPIRKPTSREACRSAGATDEGHCKPSPRACADGEGRGRAAAPQGLVRRPHRGDLAGLLVVGTTGVIASRPLIGVQFEGWHWGTRQHRSDERGRRRRQRQGSSRLRAAVQGCLGPLQRGPRSTERISSGCDDQARHPRTSARSGTALLRGHERISPRATRSSGTRLPRASFTQLQWFCRRWAASAGPDRPKVARSDCCWQNSAAHLYPIPHVGDLGAQIL